MPDEPVNFPRESVKELDFVSVAYPEKVNDMTGRVL